MGEKIYSIANLSRKLGIEPGQALRKANEKFTKRFNQLKKTSRTLDAKSKRSHWTTWKASGRGSGLRGKRPRTPKHEDTTTKTRRHED